MIQYVLLFAALFYIFEWVHKWWDGRKGERDEMLRFEYRARYRDEHRGGTRCERSGRLLG